jgi:hypothetical protein
VEGQKIGTLKKYKWHIIGLSSLLIAEEWIFDFMTGAYYPVAIFIDITSSGIAILQLIVAVVFFTMGRRVLLQLRKFDHKYEPFSTVLTFQRSSEVTKKVTKTLIYSGIGMIIIIIGSILYLTNTCLL